MDWDHLQIYLMTISTGPKPTLLQLIQLLPYCVIIILK